MKRKRTVTFGILQSVWALGAVALIGKLMGAFYRIPLTRVLGAHGMGLYQSVFPSYALIVIVTGGGLASAVSKLTAENDGRADIASLSAAAVLFSLPVTFAALVFSRAIATAAGAPESAGALAVLLPSVPLSCVASVMRGYFLGKNNVKASAFGQLVEQSVKLVCGLALAFWLSRFSLSAAVAGCAAGVSAGEGASLLYSIVAYRISVRKACDSALVAEPKRNEATAVADATAANIALAAFASSQTEASAELVPAIAESAVSKSTACAFTVFKTLALTLMRVSLPITLSLTVLPLCQVADSFVVVNMLVRAGADADSATKLYGLVTGPINSLVNLPAVFTVGLCGTLLPKISRLCSSGKEIRSTVSKVLSLSVVAGLIMGVGLALSSGFALRILYGNSLGFPVEYASVLLVVSSAAIPFMTVSQCVSAVLQGAGKSYVAAFGLLIAAFIKETLNFVLLPFTGIMGFVVATLVFYASACVMNLLSLVSLLRKKHNI